ncbi:MAG: hypothetical protein GX038_03260 [Erysipelothrix sp.]|nr:hypothetical protein [Erysipelothrix sp.]
MFEFLGNVDDMDPTKDYSEPEIQSGSNLEAGTVIRLSTYLELPTGTTNSSRQLILNISYNPEFLEVVEYEPGSPMTFPYEIVTEHNKSYPDYGILPAKGTVGPMANQSDFLLPDYTVNVNPNAPGVGPTVNFAQIFLTNTSSTSSLAQDGIAGDFLFKVKKGIPANSQLEFDLLPSSVFNTPDFTATSEKFVVSVKGEAAEEDNSLTNVSIKGTTSGGTYDYLQFSEEKTSYTDIVVPANVTSLNFSHTLKDSASFTQVLHGKRNGPGGGSVSGFNLSVGDNYFTTVVKSSTGGDVKEYNYVVKRLSNDVNFNITGVDDNSEIQLFTNKESTVRSNANSVTMSVGLKTPVAGVEFDYEISSSDTTVTGTTVQILKDRTETPFTIKFTPEDALAKYNAVPGINDGRGVAVTDNYKLLRASEDNSLSEVEIVNNAGGAVLKTSTTSKDKYVLEVANNVEEVAIKLTTNHQDANIMTPNLDKVKLTPGLNTINVQVNAPDGTQKVYVFEITRTPQKIADLESLSVKVNGVEKNAPITTVNATTTIELEYEENLKATILGVVKSGSGATLKTGNVTDSVLTLGNNNFKLVVQAEDKITEKTYNVNIIVKENAESELEGGLKPGDGLDDKDLVDPDTPIVDETPEGGEKDPSDNSIDIYRYSINVKNTKKEFSMNDLSYKLPANSTLVGGAKIDLLVGDNTFTFDVVSQDGKSTSRYIITVNRAQNDIASVDSIAITSTPQGKLSGSLATGYTYKVDASVFEYTVTAEVTDGSVIDSSTVGTFDLDGDKTHTVKVTSEDGKTTKEYEIVIERAKSDDTTLQSFKVAYDGYPENDIIGSFVNQQYTMTVPYDTEEISIVASTTHPKATFTINNTSDTLFDLKHGMNTFNVEVRSETNKPTGYTFRVERAKNNDATLSELRIDGVLVPGWNSATQTYEADDVDEDVSSLDITYVTNDPNATATLVGNDLKHGDNTVEVHVTAQDGTTKLVYGVTVNRALSSSSDLGEDGVQPDEPNHVVDQPTDSDPYRYKVYVPYGTTTYSKDDFKLDLPTGATVVYEQDEIQLDYKLKNEFKFTVTSPNGANTQDYIIEVIHMDSSTPLLIDALVNDVSLVNFDGSKNNQVVQLDPLIDEKDADFKFSVVAPSGVNVTYFNPVISVTGKQIIEQSVVITRLSDGLTSTYKFTFTRTLTSVNTLDDIVIKDGDDNSIELTPGFDENPNGPFEVTVDGDTDSIIIDGKPSNPNSDVSGDEEIQLVPGWNMVTIKVDSEDNSASKDYVIKVYREIELNELKLGEVVVDVKSGSETGPQGGSTVVYTVSEPISASTIEAFLTAVPNHISVTMSGEQNKDVVLDNSDITFKLHSQDGTSVLNVVLKYTRTLSSDARLATLESLTEDLEITNFSPDTHTYDISVDHTFTKLERDDHLKWTTMHPNTVVSAGATMDIGNSAVNVYNITAKAEDGTEIVYKLNITRGTYNFLDSLKISEGDGHIEQTFDPEVFEYDAMVYSGVESFSFEWTLQDGVRVTNANELVNISINELPNIFTITVEGDNGETNEYKINVAMGVSTRLVSMESTDGTIDFKPDVYEYDVYVPRDITKVSLVNLVAEDTDAVISGNYTDITLTGDSTTVEVNVSNAGYNSIYKVTFIKIDDLTGIDKITGDNGSNIWTGELTEDGKFEITVDDGVDLGDININVDTSDKDSKVDIVGPTINGNGDHEYTITVEDKYGISKDYDVLVKNDLSDNNYLANLTINGYKVAGFNKYATEYEIKLSADDVLDLVATAEDESADVSISKPDPIVDGSEITITVTSVKGTPRVYIVKVEKESLNTAVLDSLSLLEATIAPKFNKIQNDYYVSIPNELEAVTVKYTTTTDVTVVIESNATVKGDKVSNLVVGDNVIKVNVSNDDGSTNVYRIHVTRADVSTNFLDSLTVTDSQDSSVYSMTPKFDKNKLNYSIEVPSDRNTFIIDAEAREGLNIFGNEEIVIQDFPYVHTVRVVDEQNVARSYAITFVKEPTENPALGNLWTDQGALSPVFEANKTSYNVDVPYEIQEIEVLYDKVSDDQVVGGAGMHSLVPGRNSIEVTVTSGSAIRVYTIFVNRALSSAKLDWLTTSEGTLSPEFNKDKFMYTVEVDNDITELTVEAGSDNDSLTIVGDGLKNLDVGNNIIEVVVTDEFGTENTYYIVVTRKGDTDDEGEDSYKDDLSLAYLAITDETLNEDFDSKVLAYTADLKESFYEELEIIAIPRNPNARADYIGHTELGVGVHEITVRVFLGDETQDTIITVTIKQQNLMSDIHEVGEFFMPTVITEQTVKDVKDQMLNPNSVLRIYKDGEELSDTDIVGTGAIIKLVENDIEYDSKIIVILGDVNGDGIISIADLMKTQSYILGSELTETEMIAADVSKDGPVQINDFMMIQSHILEILDIHAKVEENN